ncbi:MAG: cytosine permease, partial [Thermoanaerobaculia bacterium]
MTQAADLGPIPDAEKTQSPVDLLLIIAGANLVATTLQTGASLAPAFGPRQAAFLVTGGVVLGTALVAALTPLGPRLGVPSVIVCRAALGLRGGALVSLLLYATNFAWIAVNN